MSEIPNELKVWQLSTGPNPVLAGNTYSLQNLQEGKDYVTYGVREWGIDLVWKNDPQDVMTFKREGGRTGPLVYGESIAIHVKNAKSPNQYLKYGSRTWGINLKWDAAPVFEWQLHGGSFGEPVKANIPIALFNGAASDFVVYYVRPVGINLGWSKSKPWLSSHLWGPLVGRIDDYLDDWLTP